MKGDAMKNLTERHVQAIWYDASLRPRRLVTRRGEEVVVLSPGEWNLEAGPDFLRAVLEVGPSHRRLVGDVEVHLAPSDWDLHGHGADPRYRNVVAHVTWGCGPVPASLPSGAISIWLGRFVTSNPAFAPEQIDLDAYPFSRLPLEGRPCEQRFAHDPDLVRRVLAEAGRLRLRVKAKRLAGRLCEKTWEGAAKDVGVSATARRQVFYEEVMTALGYKRNATAFRRVAERVPLAELPADREAAESALLVAGGFEEWDRAGMRPWNTPERRLARAAEVFTETDVMSLCDAQDFSKKSCRDMIAEMCGPGKAPDGTPRLHCMGRGRAAAILANVVAPFALAEERIREAPDWLPPEDISEPVRLTAFRLLGRDHNPAAFYSGNGLLIQGLIQIHHDCCLPHHPDCNECELLEAG
jgi:hypothetical protein